MSPHTTVLLSPYSFFPHLSPLLFYFPHTAPTVITSPPLTTISAQLDMPFTLPCNATHHPGTDVTYSWRRDGILLDTSGGGAVRFVTSTSGDIMITNVQERDAGRYTCTVQTRVQSIAGAGDQIFPPAVFYSFNVTVTSERLSYCRIACFSLVTVKRWGKMFNHIVVLYIFHPLVLCQSFSVNSHVPTSVVCT